MDLSTTFLGLELKNPIVASASPLTASLDSIKKLEDSGIAAVIMHSLFEEEINHELKQIDHFLHVNSNTSAEALEYLPDDVSFDNIQSEAYLDEVRRVKEAVDVPVIASLNGVSKGGWINYASKLQEAGADALELNITYIPTSIEMSGATVEQMYIDTVAMMKAHTNIPLNVKMNAYFSNPANMAKRFVEAGASGLTLFDNPTRVNVDLELLTALQEANITSSHKLSETLRWCAILHNKLSCSLCANTGIHSGADVLKAIMSGADATAVASALILNGEGYAQSILEEMTGWMQEKEYESITQMKGSISLDHTDNPSAYERNSYMYALQHYRS
ncbi:MAG: dihydroorotate dehydrogenase-like protein [Campylobacterota bacterium]|nr:dihydroorotate dehydrogenase-like protein [Campylobacterota bacterium]